MEALLVAVVPEGHVPQERERGEVCDTERVAHQPVPACQEGFEPVERVRDRSHPGLDLRGVRHGTAELSVDVVRRPFPHAIEPVHERLHLGPSRGIGRIERRIGVLALEPANDRRRVGHNGIARNEHGDERLPADRLDRAPIAGRNVDPVDREPLVPERERDPLDIRRKRDPVDAQSSDAASLPWLSGSRILAAARFDPLASPGNRARSATIPPHGPFV